MYFAGVAQKTLIKSTVLAGNGLHTNQFITLKLRPAAIGTGIIFKRTDVPFDESLIHAKFDSVTETRLGTVIGNNFGHKISTVEHLMSALSAYGIDNIIIECDGSEIPVMDGSASAFMQAIKRCGVKALGAPKTYLKILTPVTVIDGDKFATVSPYNGFKMKFEIQFNVEAIGYQLFESEFTQELFQAQLSTARTFGFAEEVEALQKIGLARGGSLDNAVVIKEGKVLNESGLRFDNECVRHKMLDAVGDLALCEYPILGYYHGYKSGHGLNNQLLKKIFQTQNAYSLVTAPIVYNKKVILKHKACA